MSLQTIDFSRMKLANNDRLLDLGCGEGRHAISAYMMHNLNSIGIDLSVRDLEITKERFKQFVETNNPEKSLCITAADGEHLPFMDQTFDKVICSEVLEHIPNYQAVIAEISRVLKAGGIAAISVPRYYPEWICWKISDAYHEMEGGHIRIFNSRQLRLDVESAGFILYAKHHSHSLHVPYWWLRCLFWREKGKPNAWIVDKYHEFLTWDLMKNPWITKWIDRILNPILGKSVVLYFVKTHKVQT